MLPSAAFQMIRQLDEEMRQVSMRKFWWKYVRSDPEPEPIEHITEADIIELVFGPHCEVEEPLGA